MNYLVIMAVMEVENGLVEIVNVLPCPDIATEWRIAAMAAMKLRNVGVIKTASMPVVVEDSVSQD